MLTATHPALAGLLAAIIAEPDSDDLRLIFADFLEESGESERAAFVRVQLESAKAPSCSGLRRSGHPWLCRLCRPFEALRRRERELAAAHAQSWLWKELGGDGRIAVSPTRLLVPPGMKGDTIDCSWSRGFVSEVTLRLADWRGAECRHRLVKVTPVGQWPNGTSRITCEDCRGTGRLSAHGPALVRAAPLSKVTLAEWRGESCRECCGGYVPTDRDDDTCEVCHGLYDSAAVLAWARAQPG